jgi:hypothetical protein
MHNVEIAIGTIAACRTFHSQSIEVGTVYMVYCYYMQSVLELHTDCDVWMMLVSNSGWLNL